jgi:hypothetical protein
MMLKNFDFSFVGEKEDVGMKTGATIHTMNGLYMKVQESDPTKVSTSDTFSWWERQHQLKAGKFSHSTTAI